MNLHCRHCGAEFRARVATPLENAVRLACPGCGTLMVLRPTVSLPTTDVNGVRRAVIADEPRAFRTFLGDQLGRLGFQVQFFDTGDGLVDFVRQHRTDLVIVNVYLRGRLGVDVSEEIKADENLAKTKVVLIGALFRANRFRANPMNLYGADEYIEEGVPARELRLLVQRLFSETADKGDVENPELGEARRLARLILSDIVIYNADKVESGLREGTFFDVLRDEIQDGREYYESKIPLKIRQQSAFFDETIEQFVEMKREELSKAGAGRELA